MLKKLSASQVDMKKYKSQNSVRRSSKSVMSYDNVAIMTDADVDG